MGLLPAFKWEVKEVIKAFEYLLKQMSDNDPDALSSFYASVK